MARTYQRLLSGCVLAILLTGIADAAYPASADVSGNTYTSPSYGYTITWPSNWQFVEEFVDPGLDFLGITNGITSGFFSGGPVTGTPRDTLSAMIIFWGGLAGISDFTPLPNDQGTPVQYADDQRAYAAYNYTGYFNGGAYEEVIYLGVETVSPGIQVRFSLDTILERVPATVDGFDSIPTSISINGAPLPALGIDIVALARGGPEAALAGAANGEPAPVLVDGQWRFAIASTTVGASISSLELEPKEGRDWVAIVADVTNWSSSDGTFSLRDPLIQSDAMTEAWDIAPSSTRQVARLLELETQDNDSAPIAPDASVRVVLVYSIPTGGTGLQLVLGENAMPLDEHVNATFDPLSSPEASAPPDAWETTINTLSVESSGAVAVGLAGSTGKFMLIGANMRAGGECYAAESRNAAVQHIGESVMIETDPAVEGSLSTYIYLWIIDPDGSRKLLNQQLVESGAAQVSTLPAGARFGAWLQSSEDAAQQRVAGLWAACEA